MHRRWFATSQRSIDVAILGGGIMGMATAYFLASARGTGKGIVVVEKDPTYARSSTSLSVGSVRHQFSTAENIQMSQFFTEFYREKQKEFPDQFHFREGGYLFLASEEGVGTLKENHALQLSLGAKISLLNGAEEIKKRFPFLNTNGLSAAAFGEEGEGWFDPYSLLSWFKSQATSLGVTTLTNRLHFDQPIYNVESKELVEVKLDKGERLRANLFVNALGPQASKLMEALHLNYYVQPRKRQVFVFSSPNPEPSLLNSPLVIDPTGLYWRPESSGYFLCGKSPNAEEDPDAGEDFNVDHSFFEEELWPILANRVPAFESLKVKSAWAGHYDYNVLDQNAILGYHPQVKNLLLINGFSGHGVQQAAAGGRGLSELIVHGKFKSIDLSRFSVERFEKNQLLLEKNVV